MSGKHLLVSVAISILLLYGMDSRCYVIFGHQTNTVLNVSLMPMSMLVQLTTMTAEKTQGAERRM